MRVALIAGIAILTTACRTGRLPVASPGEPAPLATTGTEAAAVEGVVRPQVEAYNRRDLGAFLATFANDVRSGDLRGARRPGHPRVVRGLNALPMRTGWPSRAP